MHHMMEKASTIWAKETGIERNPADHVEVRRPDDSRERYLSKEETPSIEDRPGRADVPEGHEAGDQPDESSDEADRVDCRLDRNALSRDSSAEVV